MELTSNSMEPTPETSDLAQRKAGDWPVTIRQKMGRSRATNRPGHLVTPTPLRQTRRRRDLIALFIEALGGPHAVSDLALVGVRRAAELTCAAEAQRATVLNGGNNAATLDALIKLEGEARRAVRALGLKLNAAKPHVPLREQWAAEAEADEDEAEPAT